MAREAGVKVVRTMVTEGGMKVRVFGRRSVGGAGGNETEMEPGVGTPVFSVGRDGREVRDVVVSVE